MAHPPRGAKGSAASPMPRGNPASRGTGNERHCLERQPLEVVLSGCPAPVQSPARFGLDLAPSLVLPSTAQRPPSRDVDQQSLPISQDERSVDRVHGLELNPNAD